MDKTGMDHRWHWEWESLCGPNGLNIWSPKTHDLGICFQQLCLQIPVLFLLAISSAYYFGRQTYHVQRGLLQLRAITLRSFIVFLLAFAPTLHVYIVINKWDVDKFTIFYFLSAVQLLTWLIHLGYTFILRRRLGLSARGPLFIIFSWTIIAVLSAINLRSYALLYRASEHKSSGLKMAFGFSIFTFILHVFYGITLIPNEGESDYLVAEPQRNDENTPLLSGSAYLRFLEARDPNYLGVAMEDAAWFSKLFFHWVSPLMQKGVEEKIVFPDDLFDLPDSLRSDTLSRKLERALIGDGERPPADHASPPLVPDVAFSRSNNNNNSLFRALHKCFWVQFYSIGALKLFADLLGFAGPMLLGKLVGFIEDKNENIQNGYGYAVGLFTTTLLGSFFNTHFNFLMAIVGLKIRGALITTIYKKTLTVSSTVLNNAFSIGEIVNFMSTDTDRVVNSCPSFHALWSIPFQIAVTLYLLYNQVGVAFLAGVIFTLILIPINKFIANKIGQLSTKMMEQKDKRIKIMTEILRGIKTIKIHVWEDHFIRLVTKFRDSEIKYLKGRKYLDALCVYFWATTPVLISILTFVTYVLLGNELTASKVFTSIALLNMLIAPLNAFPWVLNGVTEAWVSLKRIQKLLDLPDLDFDEYYDNELTENENNADVIISNATFSWGKPLSREEKEKLHNIKRKHIKDKGVGKKSSSNEESPSRSNIETGEFFLRNLNLRINKGEFIGVIGSVGSGKSSIFSAILGELNKQSGYVSICDPDVGFALVTQQPWLQRGTIRDNILFGKAYDESKYLEVIAGCCLGEDLDQLPAGDLTGIGEGGMTLSGGQKARVALARAIYQDKQIYLLDDVISAVDAKVAKDIYQNCIMGILKNKTRILCTHHLKYLTKADRVILMDNGEIQKQGKPVDVLRGIDDALPIDLELGETSLTNSVMESFKSEGNDNESNDSVLEEEFRESGTVQFGVYKSYWKAIGHLLSLLVILSLVTMQTSRNLTDWWLSIWVTNSNEKNTTNLTQHYEDYHTNSFKFEGDLEESIKYYMLIYILLACLNSVFTLCRAFLFAYGGIVAALSIHKSLLKNIMIAKSMFFDVEPLGRILNRFSSDTYTVDDSLPFILNILLAQLFGLLGSVIITIYGLPWLCLVLIPLIPIYHWLQNHYRLTSRELKRLSSVTLSPVYSHFNESLQGLAVIRSFRTTGRFKRDNEDYVEVNQKTQLASQAAAQWLGLRLQFIGVAMVTGVVIIAVIQHQFDVADPGLVGLAITYALSVTALLNGVVNAFTETEREMIAVERVNRYVEIVISENSNFITDPPYAWPSQGVIAFEDVVLNYRRNLPPSLKGVNFKTRPAEKIGVVGRTGAGKTSLFTSLFRLCEITSGKITIDSIDISHISLRALRSRLSCIPQDPFLFSGSLRDNLDPLNEYRDTEIWTAINNANLLATVRRLGGLEAEVATGGSNLSSGQRQLVCLARALLHNAKILCIDEATANIDQTTDRQIQNTLRTAFRKSTVITIAHRVQTVIDYDRVLVMKDGVVLEFDKPDVLLEDSTTYFYQLVNAE
nr:multidrug resistance-associated protein 7 [Onthophagus taurus]